jgi:hypothetical protein
MEEEPPKVDLNGGSYVHYVRPKKKPSGRSAKRPAEDPSVNRAGTDDPTDAAAESARRQEVLVRRAKGLDDALCCTYDGVDELLALDFGAQWHPTAKELNDNDQDEFMHNTLVKLGRLSRIESMGQGDPESEWSKELKRFLDRASNDMRRLRMLSATCHRRQARRQRCGKTS